MTTRNRCIRFQRARARRTVCAALVACAVASGCSEQGKSLAEVKRAFESGDYGEAVALCKHAIRRQWDTPETYYYYGASLVALGRDYEGFRQLEEAIGRDTSLARTSAEFLLECARADAERRNFAQAAGRMRKAVEYDPSVDIGPYRFLVADAYFKEKNYSRAAEFYRQGIDAFPDTSVVESAYFNLAICYAELGRHAEAKEAYEDLRTRFPRGEYKSEVAWRLANLMYADAEKQRLLGNYEETVEIIGTLVKTTTNGGLLQKSHFLLGETYEAMGDLESAYREYRAVIDVDRGASGHIVERAREKIAALEEAGLF